MQPRRYGWGIADQALSSFTNVAAAVFLARNVSAAEFGSFGIAFATYTLVLSAERALIAEPLIVRYGVAGEPDRNAAIRSAVEAAVWVGLVASTLMVLASLLTRGSLRGTLIALAIGTPGLLLQDVWRFSYFCALKPKRAFLNDLVWASALILALPVLSGFEQIQSRSVMLAWGISGSVAGVVGILQTKIVPVRVRFRQWWQEQKPLASRYLGEMAATSGSIHLAYYGIAIVSGLAAAGTIRGAQILLGPINIVMVGIAGIAIPDASRRRDNTRILIVFALSITSSLAVASILWMILLHILPNGLGESLLGATWPSTRGILFPMSIYFVALVLTNGAYIGLRALGAARRSLRARIVSSGALVVGGTLGAQISHVYGAAFGLGFAGLIGAFVWWALFLKATREAPSSALEASTFKTLLT